jgi:hypothetical protein
MGLPFSCHNLSSIHAFVLHTKELKVDADNIPELGGFLFRDFGGKYHNLYIKTPCLIRPFSEFPSMVAIYKFDYIYNNCLMSKFRNTSVWYLPPKSRKRKPPSSGILSASTFNPFVWRTNAWMELKLCFQNSLQWSLYISLTIYITIV